MSPRPEHTLGRIVLSQIGHLRQEAYIAPLPLAETVSTAEALANSRRIAALWNAAIGLDTTDLESIADLLDPIRRLAALSAAAGALAAEAIRRRVPAATAFPSAQPLQAGSTDRPTNGDQWDGC